MVQSQNRRSGGILSKWTVERKTGETDCWLPVWESITSFRILNSFKLNSSLRSIYLSLEMCKLNNFCSIIKCKNIINKIIKYCELYDHEEKNLHLYNL